MALVSRMERFTAWAWNRAAGPTRQATASGLDLGSLVLDGLPTNQRVFLPHAKRAEHIALLGKTGTGKRPYRL